MLMSWASFIGFVVIIPSRPCSLGAEWLNCPCQSLPNALHMHQFRSAQHDRIVQFAQGVDVIRNPVIVALSNASARIRRLQGRSDHYASWSMTSGTTPTGVDMTATPCAKASRIAIGRLSEKDGSTRISVCRSSSTVAAV